VKRSPYQAELATLVKSPPAGDRWLHEVKFDGYRIGCVVERRRVRLFSRRGNDWTDRFPEVVAAVRGLGLSSAIIDGEVAAVLADGRTSFQALQNWGRGSGRATLGYFAFDLLRRDGRDLAAEPLDARKEELRRLLGDAAGASLLHYSDHVVGDGERVHRQACRIGLEGIVSKLRDSPYRAGRTLDWQKTKCVKRQELVIGGFTDPEGSRVGIGALLVGTYDDGRLVFAGKVGTGFTQASSRELRRRLEALAQKTPAFSPPPKGWLGRNAHWVKPKLVAEVAFSEWTDDGKIRHPSFQGLRQDKRPEEVTREAAVAPVTEPAMPKRSTKREPARAKPKEDAASVAGIRVTHPERVLYPEAGLTKLELARFYESIARWILPHLLGRPLTLVRCPEGVAEDCFFMKHSKLWAPPALRRVKIREKHKVGDYLVVEDVAGLVSLVQMNVLELHTWNSTLDHLEEPDRIVFDLDPGPEVPWPQVIEAAKLVREVLETLGLESFVKTTGGDGLHVVVPLRPERGWEECFAFSRAVAERIAADQPARYTTAVKKKGREKKILIDYLRNNRTNTSVAAYSTRARGRAPVSVPLDWSELSARVRSDSFVVATLGKRLSRLRKDPWARAARLRQKISAAAMKAVTASRSR
jgi:bifunctional non-homologous end joining protein LigD